MIELIPKSQYKRMPWKNGLGSTNEIDLFPKDAKFPAERFQWRLSAASISAPSSFSLFPGYDRWLGILRGAGLMLNADPLLPQECVHFSGEQTIECSPINGEVLDLGLIFDRATLSAEMAFKRLPAGDHMFPVGEGTHYLTVVEGELYCEGFSAFAGDTLKIQGLSQIAFHCPGEVEVYHTSIRPKT